MSHASSPPRLQSFLQEFSVPLISGVFGALVLANFAPETYHQIVQWKPLGGPDLHFLMNEIFMVFFFGIAAKEITESCLPGGALNPVRKAINPLFGTIGGVVGPVAVYLGLVHAFGHGDVYARGWGIPTATDIALAWLVARVVFGTSHPAVNFLLLLAVADDAIGMGIIAIFYPDPSHPVNPAWLILPGAAMGIAFAMRQLGVSAWQPYIFGPGVISWLGLYTAHLHPALALVFVVPFLPAGRRDPGLFVEEDEEHYLAEQGHNPLHDYEHSTKTFVDFGLFFFAFCNAGVEFSDIGPGTWFVLAALAIGKTVGIAGFSLIAERLGFPLPRGMRLAHLIVAGLIAGMGLTVALFVAGEAFTGLAQREAKMGALFSGLLAFAAIFLGSVFRLRGHIPEEVFEVEDTETARSSPVTESAGEPRVEAPSVPSAEDEHESDVVLQ